MARFLRQLATNLHGHGHDNSAEFFVLSDRLSRKRNMSHETHQIGAIDHRSLLRCVSRNRGSAGLCHGGLPADTWPDGCGRRQRTHGYVGRRKAIRRFVSDSRSTAAHRPLPICRCARRADQWATLAANATPEYKVVSGLRRATDQQLKPLKDLGVTITPEILDNIRWEAFWDSPLNVPGDSVAHGGSTPPTAGIADQPGLPRKPEEVQAGGRVLPGKQAVK